MSFYIYIRKLGKSDLKIQFINNSR